MAVNQRIARIVRGLQEAERHVAAARRELNVTVHACPSCGLNKAEAWSEAQAGTQLDAVGRKLARLAHSIVHAAAGETVPAAMQAVEAGE